MLDVGPGRAAVWSLFFFFLCLSFAFTKRPFGIRIRRHVMRAAEPPPPPPAQKAVFDWYVAPLVRHGLNRNRGDWGILGVYYSVETKQKLVSPFHTHTAIPYVCAPTVHSGKNNFLLCSRLKNKANVNVSSTSSGCIFPFPSLSPRSYTPPRSGESSCGGGIARPRGGRVGGGRPWAGARAPGGGRAAVPTR